MKYLTYYLICKQNKINGENEIRKAMSNGSIDGDVFVVMRAEYNKFITATAEAMNRLQSFMTVAEDTNGNCANNYTDYNFLYVCIYRSEKCTLHA